jgi:hypothetical protein
MTLTKAKGGLGILHAYLGFWLGFEEVMKFSLEQLGLRNPRARALHVHCLWSVWGRITVFLMLSADTTLP